MGSDQSISSTSSVPVFIKRTRPALARLEAIKTLAAHDIGRRTGMFRTPQVLRYDSMSGVIEFEELPGLVPLRDLVAAGHPDLAPCLHQAGRALAAAHEQLRLSPDLEIPLGHEWMDEAGRNVQVHGDFAGLNLCRSSVTGEVVIIDWSLAPYFQAHGNYGSRWFDIVWFALYLHQGVNRGALNRWNPATLTRTWLGGYGQDTALAAGDLPFADQLLRRYYWRLVAYYCRIRRERFGSRAAAKHGLFQFCLWLKFGRKLLAGGLGQFMPPCGSRSARPDSPNELKHAAGTIPPTRLATIP